MWRHVASNALTLFILGLIAVAALVAWAQSQYRGSGPLAQAICLRVESGANMRKVSDDLAARKAISSPSIFRIGADYSGMADNLKAGSFLIPAGASMAEIVDTVTRGGASTCGTEIVFRIGVSAAEFQLRELDPETNRFVEMAAFEAGTEAPDAYQDARQADDTRYRIAVAEGATVWQVVTSLKQADFLTDDSGALPPEGMLAPDSYEVSAGDPLSGLIDEMRNRQVLALDEAWRNRAEGLPFDTPDEALVLASIVEKETGVPDERRQVASVFVNRLKAGIRLQSDPTVIYGETGGKAPLGRGIRQSELRRETPYNTYVVTGLPPTPIANPGKQSIEAALNPAVTDYLFFVADGSGGHAFAATLAEHNANVAKWREIEADQGNE